MIEIKNLTKIYNGKKIINDVSLDINAGEMTFIVGTSGAGKTTLLNMIGGLTKPDQGKILFEGEDIQNNLDEYRASVVGFVFQDYNLIKGMSVEDNILLATFYSGSKGEELDEILSQLDINDSKQIIDTLSGGEKQRVAFARSIAKNSRVIIADEPTGNLDSENATKLLDLLAKTKEERYVIVVTHDLEKAQKYADRIIKITDGKIENDTGSKKEKNNHKYEYGNVAPDKKSILKKILLNSFRCRFAYFTSLVLVFAIAIASIVFSISINRWAEKAITSVNISILESDLLFLSKQRDAKYARTVLTFETEEVEELKKSLSINEYVEEYYISVDDQLFLANGFSSTNANFRVINLNDFFQKRINSNDIVGDFPEKDNEIIISEEIAQELFDGDAIGKTIMLHNGNGSSVELLVVGINKTISGLEKQLTYVCSKAIKQLCSLELANFIDGSLILMDYDSISINEEQPKSGIKGKAKLVENEIAVIGKKATEKNEIMVSSALATVVFGKDTAKWPSIFEEKTYCFEKNGFFVVKITGVVEDNDLLIYVPNKLKDEVEVANPVKLDIYVSGDADATALYEKINSEGTFFCECNLEHLKKAFAEENTFFKIVFWAISLLLMMFVLFLINSFIKLTVLERRRELAILKSLGATSRDVFGYLMAEWGVITLISGVLSCSFIGIMVFVLPKIINNKYLLLDYPLVQQLAVILAFGVLFTIYLTINYLPFSKKMPAELMKN